MRERCTSTHRIQRINDQATTLAANHSYTPYGFRTPYDFRGPYDSVVLEMEDGKT